MRSKKGLLGLIFTPPILIILLIIGLGLIFFMKLDGFTLGIFDAESQLKTEYTTIWADGNDGIAVAGVGENNAFSYSGSVITYTGQISTSNGMPGTISFKHNFYAQEVAVLTRIYGGKLNNDAGFDTNGEEALFIFKPSVFEPNKVNIIKNGVNVKTIEVQNPYYLNFASVSSPNMLDIRYIGYKAQFSCDIASDEVWIRESFADQFSIKDLSFRPVKFCDAERPFTLRNIAQGETKISMQEGIMPLNRGETIPPRILALGEIVTVNYATPNVIGVTNVCAPDQANVKVAGVWVCSQVIEKTTIIREVPIRELVPVTNLNSFTFTSSEARGSFNIGSKAFKTAESYSCSLPQEGSIVRPPTPEGCYEALITYNGNQQTIKDKQLVSIADNIDVQYFASGSVQGSDMSKLDGLYVFVVKGKALDIEATGGLSFKLNEAKNINFNIINNLPSNTITLKATQKIKATNQILPSQELILTLQEGVNSVDVPINTENLGINEITLQAFYPIDADGRILLNSDKIIINTEILQEGQDTIIKFVEIEKIIEKEKIITIKEQKFITINEQGFLSRIWQWLKSLFGFN